jgi:hypothetical protein
VKKDAGAKMECRLRSIWRVNGVIIIIISVNVYVYIIVTDTTVIMTRHNIEVKSLKALL